MSTKDEEKWVENALAGVYKMMSDAGLRQRLGGDDDAAGAALAELGLPASAGGYLLNISNRLGLIESEAASGNTGGGGEGGAPEAVDVDVRSILLESFVHMRWSFWISLAMSVVLFITGMALMLAAGVQLLTGGSSLSGLAIGGLGLADFVLVFYKGPWRDIARNLANSQQVRTVAISYLSSFALLPQGDGKAFAALQTLTLDTVGMLEKYAKPAAEGGSGKVPAAGS